MSWKKSPPQKDYYAVIFASTKSDDLEGYKEMDELTLKLAQEQPGFMGYESAGDLKAGIFVSYWESMESINQIQLASCVPAQTMVASRSGPVEIMPISTPRKSDIYFK